MPYVQLSNLDFSDIKIALKEYLRSQAEFTDFDFEGSVWSNLLDVLAYNTYYTAFNTNMVVNETFLDSATLRDNVVALAKQLGYSPKSATAPKAVLNFRVDFPNAGPSEIILRRGTGFTATYDTDIFNFVAVEDIKAPVINNIATFTEIPIYEGNFVTDTYTVNANRSNRFIIKNPSADLSTLRVRVFPSQQSTVGEVYARAQSILDINGSSKVYYAEEIEDEQYEIFFGDGVLGRSLEAGNFVEITYLSTNGPESNGARTFTFNGILEDPQGNSNYNCNIRDRDYTTQPVAVGSLGGLCPSTLDFLCELVRRSLTISGNKRAIEFLRQRIGIGIAVKAGNAACVKESIFFTDPVPRREELI